jgi:hypothetical protein
MPPVTSKFWSQNRKDSEFKDCPRDNGLSRLPKALRWDDQQANSKNDPPLGDKPDQAPVSGSAG